jgi:hypothetical protein
MIVLNSPQQSGWANLRFWNDAVAAFTILINFPGLFVQELDVIRLEFDEGEIAGTQAHGKNYLLIIFSINSYLLKRICIYLGEAQSGIPLPGSCSLGVGNYMLRKIY